jgi:ribosomal-protein-alanine N-acetyltransferase
LAPEDADRILQLEQELFGVGAWSRAMLEAELSAPGRWYQVAEVVECAESGQVPSKPRSVVGYAGIMYDDEIAQVMTLGVDKQHQGNGVGKLLLQALVDKAILLGLTSVFLEVATDNAPAFKLYQGFGFQVLAVRKNYYPGNIDAYSMRLLLS